MRETGSGSSSISSFNIEAPIRVQVEVGLISALHELLCTAIAGSISKLKQVVLSGCNREVVFEGGKVVVGTFTDEYGYVTARFGDSERGDRDDILITIQGSRPYARINPVTGVAEVNNALSKKNNCGRVENILRSI